ncbi:hypothetical protein G3O08_08740 [Cryomorpha ignava]|uniref:Dockerin domain-containing protein n=1 Tax=Cryomorpha ignava TaxID=101383 RepID=A0A7K3WPW0_9FLAO|nr:dockerin type I domain-containing protein [Cryomorpha ignava]NEN23586.1 hypothetical protein [Cryomorpha ignava]
MYFKSIFSTTFVVLLSSFTHGQVMESLPGPIVVCPPGEFAGLHRTHAPQAILDKMNSRDADDPCATFVVTYVDFPPAAEAAFQEAVDIWSYSISSPVTIKIYAEWSNLGPGILGSAGPALIFKDFANAPDGSYYASALADQIAGTDISPLTPDILASFNSNFSWYFGTDGNNPFNQYDLVSVVLHEIGHGLGFSSTAALDQGTGDGDFGLGTADVNYAFDEYLLLGINGVALTSLEEGLVLANAFESNNVFCNSPTAIIANSNNQPKIYAPLSWNSGSSISHWDENTFSTGSINSLMTPQIANGESIHDPGPITLGLFEDMGWVICGTIANPPCLDWIDPSPTAGYTNFNTLFGGAPCDDGSGCPFNEITTFEVNAAEAYEVENFQENGVYTFSICNGPGAGSWIPEFTIIAPSGAVDAFGAGTGCAISWMASESGTYLIVINEAGQCGIANSTGNGYPALTCEDGTADCDPITCLAQSLILTGDSAICPDQSSTVALSSPHIIPPGGGRGIYFESATSLSGIYLSGVAATYSFNNDLNGLLSANGYTPFLGEYSLTAYVYTNASNPTNSICSFAESALNVNFLDENDPQCLPTTSVNGNVVWNQNCGERAIVVSFYQPGTSVLNLQFSGMMNDAGNFTVPDLDLGSYDALIKVEGLLAKIINDFEVSAGGDELMLSGLIRGDINNNNSINIVDLSILNASYGFSSASPNYNHLADLNCDGAVNIVDISILNVGFGMVGAVAGN